MNHEQPLFSSEAASMLLCLNRCGDERILQKHRELLWKEIVRACENKQDHLTYQVPTSLFGPYPMYQVKPIVSMLVVELRKGGFSAEISDFSNNSISVWWKARKTHEKEVFSRFLSHSEVDQRDACRRYKVKVARKLGVDHRSSVMIPDFGTVQSEIEEGRLQKEKEKYMSKPPPSDVNELEQKFQILFRSNTSPSHNSKSSGQNKRK